MGFQCCQQLQYCVNKMEMFGLNRNIQFIYVSTMLTEKNYFSVGFYTKSKQSAMYRQLQFDITLVSKQK